MARRSQDYLSQTDFRGGINTEPENAAPNQVLDASNVWAPQGKLEQRPGYQVLGLAGPSATQTNASTPTIAIWDSSGVLLETFTIGVNAWDFNDLAAGSYFGFGFSSLFTSFGIEASTTNSTTPTVVAEYWNGSRWADLPNMVPDRANTTIFIASGGVTDSLFMGTLPSDAANNEPDLAKYSVRFKLLGAAFGASVGASSIDAGYRATSHDHTTNTRYTHLLQQARFPSKTIYYRLYHAAAAPTNLLFRSDAALYVQRSGSSSFDVALNLDTDSPRRLELPTSTTLPDTQEVYVGSSVGACRYYFDADTVAWSMSSTDSAANPLDVEARDIYVGTVEGIKSTYHPDYVAQLEEFPVGKYVLFHKNVLFVAGLQNEPYTVYWSAPSPAHRVFPSESYELFSDTDNSPITGLSTFGEHVVVFRRDSIWLLVDDGIDDLGLQRFLPVKVVDGVGCVAHSSIQRIPGALLFLAEDGVYRFDGTPNIVCVSKHIDSIIQDINYSYTFRCHSVHWQTQKAYLLSIPSGSSAENNKVLVYDYAHNAWWVWDIAVGLWLRLEDSQDKERIYFIGNNNLMSELGPYPTDWGTTITSYVKTHRMAYQDRVKKRFGEVYIEADNAAQDLSVEVEVDDEAFGTALTLNFESTAEAKWDEHKWDTDKWVGVKRREQRGAVRKTGEWCTVKVTNSTKGTEMNLNGIHIGAIPLGRR